LSKLPLFRTARFPGFAKALLCGPSRPRVLHTPNIPLFPLNQALAGPLIVFFLPTQSPFCKAERFLPGPPLPSWFWLRSSSEGLKPFLRKCSPFFQALKCLSPESPPQRMVSPSPFSGAHDSRIVPFRKETTSFLPDSFTSLMRFFYLKLRGLLGSDAPITFVCFSRDNRLLWVPPFFFPPACPVFGPRLLFFLSLFFRDGPSFHRRGSLVGCFFPPRDRVRLTRAYDNPLTFANWHASPLDVISQ